MSTYNKPHLTFEEQLALLKSRGLEVTNDTAALEYLRRLGYYRLSGYLYPFRELVSSKFPSIKHTNYQRSERFISGAKFQDAVSLYVFDKKLRLLILDAIERIELAFRVDIAYLMGEKDPFAHIKSNLLHGNFAKKLNPKTELTRHQEWLSKHDSLVNRSKEDFVAHYKSKYGLPLPIWVSIELWDFGLLSNFYAGMKVNDKAKIATRYGVPNWQLMESWLRSLNYVRNIVAHHSRLWNKNLVDQPKMPKQDEILKFNSIIDKHQAISRVYIILHILAYFMSYICPRSLWYIRVKDLILSFPTVPLISVRNMGFPDGWENHVIWKR